MQYRCENITFGKILAIIKITLNLFIKINRLLGEETSLPRLMSRVRIPSPAPIQSHLSRWLFCVLKTGSYITLQMHFFCLNVWRKCLLYRFGCVIFFQSNIYNYAY